jgi:hypothetical protein
MQLFGLDERRRQQAHEENLESCADTLLAAVERHREAVSVGAHDHARVLNVAVFATIWNADLNVLLEDLRRLKDAPGTAAGWRRKLTARLLALTIVEAADEFTSLLGREFRSSVNQLNAESTVPQLNAVHGELSRFRAAHGGRLRALRNTVVAHRDPDASAQIEALRTLNVGEVETLGWELLRWTNSLHHYVTDVMAASRGAAA